MRAPPTQRSKGQAGKNLAAWENEGGAGQSAQSESQRQPAIARRWMPLEAQSLSPKPQASGDPDTGIVDRHTLGMMQVSLLLLVPVLAALAIFWASMANVGRGEGLG